MQAAMSAWLEYTACQHALHRAEVCLMCDIMVPTGVKVTGPRAA